jgi:integrase
MPRKRKRSGAIAGFWLSQRRNSDAWCATWFDPRTRQTCRTSLGTEDIREAEVRLAAFALDRTRLKDARPDDVPLEAILMTYWREHARHRPSAEAGRIALAYWSGHFAGATVAEITPQRIDQFVAELRGRGHASSYISRTLSAGRAALQRAHKRGELLAVPFIADVQQEEPPERYILSPDEARALIEAADQEHLHTFLMLAFCTLARPGAILALTWPQVNLHRRIIDFNAPGQARTNKRRPVVPICQTLAAHLPTERRAMYVVHYYGQPIAEVKRSFRRARDRAGLPPEVSPYCIRHTMATVLREAGVPEWECASWLGHRLPGYKTTERYARHRPDYLQQACQAIEAWLQRVLTPGETNTEGERGINSAC